MRHLFPFFFSFYPNVLFTEPLENRFLFSLGEFIVLSLLFFSGEVFNTVLWSEGERKQALFVECQVLFFFVNRISCERSLARSSKTLDERKKGDTVFDFVSRGGRNTARCGISKLATLSSWSRSCR